jgi:hypothetical protein
LEARFCSQRLSAAANFTTRTGMKPHFAFALMAAFAPLATAQQEGQPNPADPGARVPAAKYESPFKGYVPYREEKLAPWRELNEEVGRVGGHVGIFGGGHAGHGSAKPEATKPAAGQPAASGSKEPAGQAPDRTAPKAPQGGHAEH